MSTRRKPHQAEQLALFGAARTQRVKRGVDLAIRHGQAANFCDSTLDAGLIALARTLAVQIDTCASAGGDGWLLARLAGELRETLTRLRLDPTARGATSDNLDDFLRALSEPTGPVRDTPQ